MKDVVYDIPSSNTDPFKNVSKEVITDRNDLVLQQFLEKQERKKQGIADDVDILVNSRLNVDLKVDKYPEFIVEKKTSDET